MSPDPILGKKIDELLSNRFKSTEPGAAVIVTLAGNVLFRKGYGLANLELNVPIQPEMVFRLGSITKQFTAVACLILEERGLLSIQDEITRFLPDYPVKEKPITIEQLLTHTSGILSYTDMSEWLSLWRKDLSVNEIIDLFKDQPAEFEPGANWKYCNSGYILLGAIIEKASGKSYTQFIREEIFQPLGMDHSFYDDTSLIITGRISGYSKDKDQFINAPYLSMNHPYAAGSLASSVDDLARWDESLYGEKLLKQESLQKAFIPKVLPTGENTHYGYGWGIQDLEGLHLIQHDGGINGFVTSAIRIPTQKIYVALLTNSDGNGDVGKLCLQVAFMALGKTWEEPQAVTLPDSEFQDYPGVYQIDKKTERIITLIDGKLFSLRSGGSKYELLPLAVDLFFFKESGEKIHFERDQHGKVTAIRKYASFGPDEVAPRTDKPIPLERQAANIPVEGLQKLTGSYELAPGILLSVFMEGEKLYIQMTGQEKDEVFPESDRVLFSRNVDALIEFQLDEMGEAISLTIHQGGDQHLLKKI